MRGVSITAPFLAALLLSASLISTVVDAQPVSSAPVLMPAMQSSPPPARKLTPEQVDREKWRTSMSRSPNHSGGCAKAVYPGTDWQQVPCSIPPAQPVGRPLAPHTEKISPAESGGNDFIAVVSC
jgi:hypothetical protein